MGLLYQVFSPVIFENALKIDKFKLHRAAIFITYLVVGK
jgi:hypothetical protein